MNHQGIARYSALEEGFANRAQGAVVVTDRLRRKKRVPKLANGELQYYPFKRNDRRKLLNSEPKTSVDSLNQPSSADLASR